MANKNWTPPRDAVPFGLLPEGQDFLPFPEDDDSVGFRKIEPVYIEDEEYNADCHNNPINTYNPNTRYRRFDYWTLVWPQNTRTSQEE